MISLEDLLVLKVYLGQHLELRSFDERDRKKIINGGGVVECVESHVNQLRRSIQYYFTCGLAGKISNKTMILLTDSS